MARFPYRITGTTQPPQKRGAFQRGFPAGLSSGAFQGGFPGGLSSGAFQRGFPAGRPLDSGKKSPLVDGHHMSQALFTLSNHMGGHLIEGLDTKGPNGMRSGNGPYQHGLAIRGFRW